MSTTAVVLCDKPYDDRWLKKMGLHVVIHLEREPFTCHADINRARRAALAKVKTTNWFFLDSDDCLPVNFKEVLGACLDCDKPIVYTDELIISDRQDSFRRQPGEYTQDKFIRNALMVHHMVLCRTQETLAALKVIPNGRELMETCLYFQLAKLGIAYVDQIGYHWYKHDAGMHRKHDALEHLTHAAAWCARNRE